MGTGLFVALNFIVKTSDDIKVSDFDKDLERFVVYYKQLVYYMCTRKDLNILGRGKKGTGLKMKLKF